MDVDLGHGHAPWLALRGCHSAVTPPLIPPKHPTSNTCASQIGVGGGLPLSSLSFSRSLHLNIKFKGPLSLLMTMKARWCFGSKIPMPTHPPWDSLSHTHTHIHCHLKTSIHFILSAILAQDSHVFPSDVDRVHGGLVGGWCCAGVCGYWESARWMLEVMCVCISVRKRERERGGPKGSIFEKKCWCASGLSVTLPRFHFMCLVSLVSFKSLCVCAQQQKKTVILLIIILSNINKLA